MGIELGHTSKELQIREMASTANRKLHVLAPCQNKLLRLDSPDMPGMESRARFVTNSDGIRGRELRDGDRHRILGLGCSVALSKFVDQERFWGYWLQEKLSRETRRKVWVGVAARDEVTSRDVVTLMRHFLPQVPRVDIVLVWVGINDIALMLSKGKQYDAHYYDKLETPQRLLKAFEDQRGHTSLRWYASFLCALRCAKHHLIADHHSGVDEFYAQKRRRRQRADIVEAMPDIREGLAEYERNVDEIVALARRQSVLPVFVTPAAIWKPHQSEAENRLLWFGWIGNSSRFYSTNVLSRVRQQYKDRLTAKCHESGTLCIDLDAVLPRDTSAFYDDVHLNVHGNEVVGQYIAERLVPILREM